MQSELPMSLKKGGKTRPWRSLVNMFSSIQENLKATEINGEVPLQSMLRKRGRLNLLDAINKEVLSDVLEFLQCVNSVFDILEYAKQPTLQNVVPAFYLLRNK